MRIPWKGWILFLLIGLFGCFRSPVSFHPPAWLQGEWRSSGGQRLTVTERDFFFQSDQGLLRASDYFGSLLEERSGEQTYMIRGRLAWPYSLAHGEPIDAEFVRIDQATLELRGIPGQSGTFSRASSASFLQPSE